MSPAVSQGLRDYSDAIQSLSKTGRGLNDARHLIDARNAMPQAHRAVAEVIFSSFIMAVSPTWSNIFLVIVRCSSHLDIVVIHVMLSRIEIAVLLEEIGQGIKKQFLL